MSSIMDGSMRVVEEEGMNPIRYLWQTVCDRVREVCQPVLQHDGYGVLIVDLNT